MTNQATRYAIGTPGVKWGPREKTQWLRGQSIKRSYRDEVILRIEALRGRFEVEQYGALSCNEERYPLFAVSTPGADSAKLNVLVTGGVHGYETSGVQGAIRFLETVAPDYAARCNILVAPCISPWAYETINRWNPNAVDPNRSFFPDSPSEEAAALMRHVRARQPLTSVHIDLHETTDTDNSEFRPALAARDALQLDLWEDIPDGFYLVADSGNPQPGFQQAIIGAVEAVTHIAPPDANGNIIGERQQHRGVIYYDVKKLGLCAGFTQARYSTTTEVYPDSPGVDAENCILAQVAAIRGGLDYLLATGP